MILASCEVLSIENTEISGCLQYCGELGISYSFILYDTTPGGAGNVRRLNNKEVLQNVFTRAYNRSNNCHCGGTEGDSSCYFCLRTYQNQKYHDILKRRYVINFFGEILDGVKQQ